MFGEMSALSRYPVAGTLTAASAATFALVKAPALRLFLRNEAFKDFVDRRYRERSLVSQLLGVPLFSRCSPQIIEDLKARAELASFEPNDVIVAQGSRGDAFFLIRGGYVRVGARVGETDVAVTYLRKGDHAGSAALLFDEPWPVTLSALEHVDVVRIERSDFDTLVDAHPEIRQRLLADRLESTCRWPWRTARRASSTASPF